MKHQVSTEGWDKYEFEHEIVSSHGRGDSKKLLAIVCNGIVFYKVISKGKDIIRTNNINEAVEAYNQH